MLLKGTVFLFSLLKLGNSWPLEPQRAQSALSLKKACDMNPKINTSHFTSVQLSPGLLFIFFFQAKLGLKQSRLAVLLRAADSCPSPEGGRMSVLLPPWPAAAASAHPKLVFGVGKD